MMRHGLANGKCINARQAGDISAYVSVVETRLVILVSEINSLD